MRVGQARKRDASEMGIRKALEAVGATVIPVSGKGHPDLFVFYQGQWWAAEVKSKGGKLTDAQQASGAGQTWPIWRTPEDALQTIGALR